MTAAARPRGFLESAAPVCALFAPWVYGGRLPDGTVIAPGAWRGTAWPCPGHNDLRAADVVIGRVTCTCECHQGLLSHVLPRRSRRTGVHPTEIPEAPCATT